MTRKYTRRLCPGYQCKNVPKKNQLMCPSCWALVPPETQDEVYETYSENPGGTARYSDAHYVAVLKAIRAVRSIQDTQSCRKEDVS